MTEGLKISELTAGTPALSTDAVPLARSGANRNLTVDNIAAFAVAKLVYNVRDYGALGDGATDDTAALNAALAACVAGGGGIVFLPPSTYEVTPAVAGGTILSAGGQNVHLIGAGRAATTIKVANSSLAYKHIVSGVSGAEEATDLSGLEVAGITFDFNIANNAITGYATNNFQMAVGAYNSSNISIHDCAFINGSSVNIISVNGAATQRVNISDNLFYGNGDDPAHTAHDVSLIYLHGSDAVIAHNIIEAVSLGAPGAITAIETHGNRHVIQGNAILNYRYGMNVTGVSATDSQNITVEGNTISGALVGMYLWSMVYTGHVSGYGLDGVVVANNVIRLAGLATYTTGPEGGIVLYPSASPAELDAANLTITGNIIIHPLEGGVVANSTLSLGIGWVSQGSKVLHNCAVSNNTIVGFPCAGIRLSCGLDGIRISGNHLVNCGSTLDTSLAAAYRTPIFITTLTSSIVTIENNIISDTNDPSRIPGYINITKLDSLTPAQLRVQANTLIATGVDQSSIGALDALVIPYPLGANPSVSAGLAAVNGSAKTFMRSDGAPAINVAINPTWTGTHRFSNDVYPAGDLRGMMVRLVNRYTGSPTEHFRSGVIPAGFTWQGAPFGDTPANLAYAHNGDFIRAFANSGGGRVFLSKAITNSAAAWQNQIVAARLRTGATTEIGVRVDDGTDTNYADLYLSGTLANGLQRLDFRHCEASSLTTATSSVIIPCSEYLAVILSCVYVAPNYSLVGYILAEDGAVIQVFSSGTVTWMPAAGRVGIMWKENVSYAYADWLHSTFG